MQRCAELAAERLSEANLREMEKALDALAVASSSGDRAEAKRAHDLFYGLILSGSRNPLRSDTAIVCQPVLDCLQHL
jgi:DNA-binding GntR family transcriptional regulator